MGKPRMADRLDVGNEKKRNQAGFPSFHAWQLKSGISTCRGRDLLSAAHAMGWSKLPLGQGMEAGETGEAEP